MKGEVSLENLIWTAFSFSCWRRQITPLSSTAYRGAVGFPQLPSDKTFTQKDETFPNLAFEYFLKNALKGSLQ
jgi:hypothetical protein